ncbi:MAG: hypothetical protein MJZ57_07770 [Bacteroidales bacterium]|nr:hypothetical protein [Bacteroidales bacterium]
MGNRLFGQNSKSDTVKLLSPFDFGLNEAQTDSARYDVLFRPHTAAVESGAYVDYSGMTELSIEVTADAQPIPLTPKSDFGGLVLNVKNKAKNCFIFRMVMPADSIPMDKKMLDGKDFSAIQMLDSGMHLLVIEDQNLWVEKRSGYNYGATRRDLLLIDKGKAQNTTTASYQTDASNPKCTVINASKDEKLIANLTIKRSEESTYKAKCFQIVGLNNLRISKVSISTPKNNLQADEAISIANSANVLLEDVTIEGTYSQPDKYGYGILLNNVWNIQFVRLVGHANWGIFGTNNVNKATLTDCDINRFDVHCYGRDVKMVNCHFSKLYNQFSSVFGEVCFEGCRFTNFTPVLIETSYNAYTGFDLVFRNCVFDVTESKNFMVSMGYLTETRNSRPELYEKCWPNVTIKNLTVNVPDAVNSVVLFKPKGTISKKMLVGYINKVKIDGLKFNYSGSGHAASFYVCSEEVLVKNNLTCNFDAVDLLPVPDSKIAQATKKFYYPASIYFNLHRNNGRDLIRITNSRLNYNANANAYYNINFSKCTIGLVRYTSISSTAARAYKNCKIYLNCIDDKRYYIDNHAYYDGCTFIPCSDKMFVDFFGSDNNVTIKNCQTTRKFALLYKGKKNNEELKKFVVKGIRK